LNKVARFYEFDSFRIDVLKRQLLRDGIAVRLKPKAFETLLVLVQNSGRVLEKNELMEMLWASVFVEESNLTQHISLVRKALGESPNNPRYIVTIPGRGYRFAADVREFMDNGSNPSENNQSEQVVSENETDEPILPVESVHSPAAVRSLKPLNRAQWLRFSAALLLFIGLAALFFYLWSHKGTQLAETRQQIRSIAVLPFKSPGGQPEEDYLRLGLTDSLISRFSGLSQVTVRRMNETLKFDKLERDPVAAARALAVDAVLDGVIQRTGDRVRVTARLLDARTGETLWAQTFDERWTDIFAVQDTISLRVSETLASNLSGRDRKKVARRYTNSAEAYELYLQGAYLSGKRTLEALERSDEYFNRALELDPNFALAYQGLATNYSEPRPLLSPREAQKKEKEYLLKALKLDDTLGTSNILMAHLTWRGELNKEEAERYFRRALEIEPNALNTHWGYGVFLAEQGRVGEAIDELRRALSLNPVSLGAMSVLGTMYLYARQYDDAIKQYEKVLELEPNYSTGYVGLGWAYTLKGQYDAAEASLTKAAELEKLTKSNVHAFLGYLYAVTGERTKTMNEINQLNELQKQRQGSFGAMAVVYAGLGEKDQAFAYLEKALEEREWWVFSIKVNPVFDSLRSDPRYIDLLSRIGLKP
jgi:DNA-binding winged helix-turn-helix (wHTH) protein/TolB-like protein/Flp pilus assembly protein TadD